MQCRKCEGPIKKGYALDPRGNPKVSADFSGDYSGSDVSKAKRGQTISFAPLTQPVLIDVYKCEDCGHSFELGPGPYVNNDRCRACGRTVISHATTCFKCYRWVTMMRF